MTDIKQILCTACAAMCMVLFLAGCQLAGEAGNVSNISGEESGRNSGTEDMPASSAISETASSSGADASRAEPLPEAATWAPARQLFTLSNGRTATLTVSTAAPVNSREENTEYVLNCSFAGQTDCFPLGKRAYSQAFLLSATDYNNDGNPDFALGEYNSDSGNLFRIFSIYPDGTIRALSKPFFAFDTSVSPAFALSEMRENAFQVETFDKELQQRVRGSMCWDDTGSFNFQYEENIPNDSGAVRSDGVTNLFVTAGGMKYHLTQPETDTFSALLAQVKMEPLASDRVGELPDVTCAVTIERNGLQDVLELPYFQWNGVPQRAAAGARELVDFLSGISCFDGVDLLPDGFAVGRGDGIHRVSLFASGGSSEILLDETQLDAFFEVYRRLELKPVRTPKDMPVNDVQLSIESDDGQQIYFLPNWEDMDGYFYTAVAGQEEFFSFLSRISGISIENPSGGK